MENIEAMLCAYIEGDLDEAGRAQIEKHLQDHPQHRKLIESLTATRDLMRDLPRAKAPPDVGEWLHGQVERSILLDDSAAVPIQRAKPSRWPQWLGVAAVLLLFAALGAIVMRMVAPTFKAPVAPTASTVQLPTAPPAPTEDLKDLAKTKNPTAQDREALALGAAPAQLRQSAQAPAPMQLDVQAVRQRLQNFGYAANADATDQASPLVLVVNSSNRSNTAGQITQFLNTQNGISWRQVPEESAKSPLQSTPLNASADQMESNAAVAGQLPATRPEAPMLLNQVQSNQSQNDYVMKADKNATENQSGSFASAPTTQPLTDMYVAHGMTVQQADQLRRSLAAQPDVQACQVYPQLALDLPSTRPAANTNLAVAEQQEQKSAGAEIPGAAGAASPSTQPTTAPALADTAASLPKGSASFGGFGGGGGASNSQMALANIDAVIVVQPAAPVPTESTPAPTTEPTTAAPPPATQP
jgi:hypothetical protein